MSTAKYTALIDPADFGLIADYLRSPRSPIHYLVHVKSEEALATLAAELDSPSRKATPPWLFPEPIENGLRDRSLLLSSRRFLDHPESKQQIDPSTIPRDKLCRVIYAPPFYLVHTPGLFEGTLVRQSPSHERTIAPQGTAVRLGR